MKFHFISGLPRSGSTLLAAILRRNPCLHAGMTSPFGALFNGMLATFTAGSEFAKFPALSFWHERAGSAANVIRLANAPPPDLASVNGC